MLQRHQTEPSERHDHLRKQWWREVEDRERGISTKYPFVIEIVVLKATHSEKRRGTIGHRAGDYSCDLNSCHVSSYEFPEFTDCRSSHKIVPPVPSVTKGCHCVRIGYVLARIWWWGHGRGVSGLFYGNVYLCGSQSLCLEKLDSLRYRRGLRLPNEKSVCFYDKEMQPTFGPVRNATAFCMSS